MSDAVDDHPPLYPGDSDPPQWTPRFERLSLESPGRLSQLQHQPLDPPPECFSTPSPLRIRSHDFPSFGIPSVSHRLSDGFQLLFPCAVLDKHGISRSDWHRFLEDLTVAAKLAMQGLSAVGSRASSKSLHRHAPSMIPAPGAIYDVSFTRSPLDEVKALIGVWNESAFERRKLSVRLQTKEEQAIRVGYELVVNSL